MPEFGLHGLDAKESLIAVWLLLSCPGLRKSKGRVYFETTSWFGREEEDFRELLCSNEHPLSRLDL
jgi:hypothetical protein